MSLSIENNSFDAKIYYLSINCNPNSLQYKIEQKIVLSALEDKKIEEVRFHSLGLQIRNVKVTHVGIDFFEEKIEDVKQQIVGFKCKPFDVKTGDEVIVELVAERELDDKMTGCYFSEYKVRNEETGEEVSETLVCTQFEPCDARRAFVGFDSPEKKAEYLIDITAPKEYTVLSNGREVNREIVDNDLIRVFFEKTPKMSTYLVAWVIGKLDFIEIVNRKGTTDGFPFRCYATPGQVEKGKFALKTLVGALDYFETVFGIPYPMNKIDMVAIPSFSAGAMENWSLITYRDTRLLQDEDNQDTEMLQACCLTVCHEVSHSWFGNLVSMVDWNQLFLNEGSAKCFEYFAADHIYPEWKLWSQFTKTITTRAMDLDSLETSHPIHVEVTNPSEVNEIFDGITYAKGACLLRQTIEYLTPKKFFAGLTNYLNEFAYSNATTEALWNHLSDSIKPMMDKWLKQVGYPVVMVSHEEAEDGKLRLKFKQERFLSNGKTEHQSLWDIPICYKTATMKVPKVHLMKAREESILVDNDDWVKINYNSWGFYRCSYSPELLSRLSKADLPVSDRLMLVYDQFNLAFANRVSIDTVLRFALNSFKNETDFTVLNNLACQLSKLGDYIEEENLRTLFNEELVYPLFEHHFQELGFMTRQKDDHGTKLLRRTVISLLLKANYKPAIDEALKIFETGNVEPNLRLDVWKTCVKYDEKKNYPIIKAIQQTTTDSTERVIAIRAMCYCQDRERLLETIDYVFNSGKVQSSNLIYPIVSLAANRKSRDLIWSYVKANWDKIWEKLGDANFLLAGIAKYSTVRFISFEKAKEVREFFEKNDHPNIARSWRQSVEEIENNATFLSHQGLKLTEFFPSK